ncbi:hypothetical protein Q5424_02090 [Conexibacter sp. JD483]|uniref:hypothetical protein n=1 Tax=unclassified Conexibacter TaxID=2627773 RepID=UPI00271D5CA2|nr:MULTISPECIES: hypothetical protein [unclassified Conexibacter]MDO8185627.1 hypothetical protein [Conexibacter sp. CPCC 205706]MDO8198800.1 hypothetical protein [Conexibacter sp. CPCC 205762]MDR9367850.1 hypothetical protein [Conexibacter sp. JD483]
MRLGVAQAAAEQLGPERMHRAHGQVLAAFTELIDRGRAAGVMRDDLPRDWLATALLALTHAAGDEVRAGRRDADAAPQPMPHPAARAALSGRRAPSA